MVRRCPVGVCRETDQTILAHRFPMKLDMANQWRDALNLKEFSIDELQKKFVICTKHFKPSSYRNEISNSLNTTAVPNLLNNIENERIQMTNPAVKIGKDLVPARCHKLPPYITAFIDKNSNGEKRAKRSRRESLTKSTEDLSELIRTSTKIVQVKEVAETFQVFEMHENELAVESQEEIEEEEALQLELDTQELEEQETVTAKIFTNQDTQTDPPLPQEEQKSSNTPSTNLESKDDKLIGILYPEFQDMTKIQLIELLNERSRKIESLEEKVKKLELAMRNLL